MSHSNSRIVRSLLSAFSPFLLPIIGHRIIDDASEAFCYRPSNTVFLDEPRPQYALLQLDFLKARNFEHHLLVPANADGLMISAKELRLFFGIRYNENLGDLLQQFSYELGGYIPEEVNAGKSQIEKDAIVHTLSKKRQR